MMCSRGSICKESDHEVKTLDKALEWSSRVVESDLPVMVNQITASNGRVMLKVYDNNKQLIESRG